MIEFGKTLRSAREAKGYTVSQVAEMTHLKSSTVEGLENEDFSMIAAPIYGRGFVKLYCEVVGLDAKPLVSEFMAIVNGEHEIAIKERTVSDESPEREEANPRMPEQPTATPSEPEQQPSEPDLFEQGPIPTPPPLQPPFPPAEDRAAPAPSLSRYAAPVRHDSTHGSVPPFNLRIVALAVAGLALLTALFFGIRALYRATSSDARESAATEAVADEPAANPGEPAADSDESPANEAKPAPRTPQEIPQLYID